MRHPSRIAQLAMAVLAGALLAGGGYALASSSTTTITGCVNKKSHELLIQKRCGKGQRRLVWNQEGPQGKQGVAGVQGSRGVQGPTGATGPQGIPGTSPAIWWARVASSGAVVAGSHFSVGRVGLGEYQVIPQGATGSLSPPCAVTVTPDVVSADGEGQPVTIPVTAAVGTSGLSQPGAAITILLNNSSTGAPVDDGFSVIAEC